MGTVWSTEGLVPNDRYNLRVINAGYVTGMIANKTELKRTHLGGTAWQSLNTELPSCTTPRQPTMYLK